MKIVRQKTFSRLDINLPELQSKTGDRGRYYCTPEGIWVPSITTILGHFKKKHIYQWRQRVGEEEANKISKKASQRGTRFHSISEKYLMNEDADTLLEKASLLDYEMFNNAIGTFNRIDNIIVQEKSLCSKKLRVAGRCDLIAEFDGELSIIDFKTSSKVKERKHISDYFEQAVAYGLMFFEMTEIPVKQFVIIIATEDKGTDVHLMKTKEKDFSYTAVNLFDKINEYHKQCVPSIT